MIIRRFKFFCQYDTRIFLQSCRDFIKGRVLDLGCGRAKYRELILASANEYVGADKYSKSEDIVKCDADRTPFPDESFDTVVCTQVIEHVLEPSDVIREINRVLKKQGFFILVTPWLHPYHGEPEDYYRFSKDALLYLLKKNGFKAIKISTSGGRWRVIETFSRRWLPNFLYIMLFPFFIIFDYLFGKSGDDTPSHLVIASKV